MKLNHTSLFIILLVLLAACHSDRRQETVSNYLKLIWKVNSDGRLQLLRLAETDTIRGRDSLEWLTRQYATGGKTLLPADSLIHTMDDDIRYNENLLRKTTTKIDSFKHLPPVPENLSFYTDYVKSLEQLRDFTQTELNDIRLEKSLLDRYRQSPDQVLCHVMTCDYLVRNAAPDTASRKVSQQFYLSADTRHVLLVK